MTYSFIIIIAFLHYTASEPESEDDKTKKEVRDKMKQEYFFAIQEEGELVYV